MSLEECFRTGLVGWVGVRVVLVGSVSLFCSVRVIFTSSEKPLVRPRHNRRTDGDGTVETAEGAGPVRVFTEEAYATGNEEGNVGIGVPIELGFELGFFRHTRVNNLDGRQEMRECAGRYLPRRIGRNVGCFRRVLVLRDVARVLFLVQNSTQRRDGRGSEGSAPTE